MATEAIEEVEGVESKEAKAKGLHFIFGYGSLISSESREKTGDTGEWLAVTVTGVERSWNYQITAFDLTALAVVDNPEAQCNGIVFQIDEDQLPKFDEREVGYSRRLLDTNSVTPWNEEMRARWEQHDPSLINVWVYFFCDPKARALEYPLIQSYVDVILTGCLEQGHAFAEAMVRHTTQWDGSWTNDRNKPIYPRALAEVKEASAIFGLLRHLKSCPLHHEQDGLATTSAAPASSNKV